MKYDLGSIPKFMVLVGFHYSQVSYDYYSHKVHVHNSQKLVTI